MAGESEDSADAAPRREASRTESTFGGRSCTETVDASTVFALALATAAASRCAVTAARHETGCGVLSQMAWWVVSAGGLASAAAALLDLVVPSVWWWWRL
jgi:hypothetical protein